METEQTKSKEPSQIPLVPVETKKRGRKPKETPVPSDETSPVDVKVAKKRGRKPKEKIYSVSKDPVSFNIQNVSDNLLHLNKINKHDFEIKPQKSIKTFENDSKPYFQF